MTSDFHMLAIDIVQACMHVCMHASKCTCSNSFAKEESKFSCRKHLKKITNLNKNGRRHTHKHTKNWNQIGCMQTNENESQNGSLFLSRAYIFKDFFWFALMHFHCSEYVTVQDFWLLRWQCEFQIRAHEHLNAPHQWDRCLREKRWSDTFVNKEYGKWWGSWMREND